MSKQQDTDNDMLMALALLEAGHAGHEVALNYYASLKQAWLEVVFSRRIEARESVQAQIAELNELIRKEVEGCEPTE